MRIAYVITRADAVGGASVHVLELAAAMLERGHEARVFVGGEGPVTERLEAAGVPFRRLHHLRRPVNPVRDVLAFRELGAELQAFRPDLVSTHTAKAGWLGRAAARRLGVAVIYSPHGWPLAGRMPGPVSAAYLMAERAAARWASKIICVCEYERQLALRSGIGRPDQLAVIHNGVRDVPLRADPATEPVRLVSLARFEPPKHPEALLRALAPLAGRVWVLDFVGDGPLQASCRKLSQDLGLESRVRFLGYREDVAEVLASAQIFALSSRSEAFPRSVLEAMRAGLPVVASDVGGISEAVDNGISGFLVGCGGERQLSASIGGLIDDAGARQRLGRAARLTYESKFRLERMIEKTAALYGAVVGHDARKRSQF